MDKGKREQEAGRGRRMLPAEQGAKSGALSQYPKADAKLAELPRHLYGDVRIS